MLQERPDLIGLAHADQRDRRSGLTLGQSILDRSGLVSLPPRVGFLLDLGLERGRSSPPDARRRGRGSHTPSVGIHSRSASSRVVTGVVGEEGRGKGAFAPDARVPEDRGQGVRSCWRPVAGPRSGASSRGVLDHRRQESIGENGATVSQRCVDLSDRSSPGHRPLGSVSPGRPSDRRALPEFAQVPGSCFRNNSQITGNSTGDGAQEAVVEIIDLSVIRPAGGRGWPGDDPGLSRSVVSNRRESRIGPAAVARELFDDRSGPRSCWRSSSDSTSAAARRLP